MVKFRRRTLVSESGRLGSNAHPVRSCHMTKGKAFNFPASFGIQVKIKLPVKLLWSGYKVKKMKWNNTCNAFSAWNLLHEISYYYHF